MLVYLPSYILDTPKKGSRPSKDKQPAPNKMPQQAMAKVSSDEESKGLVNVAILQKLSELVWKGGQPSQLIGKQNK